MSKKKKFSLKFKGEKQGNSRHFALETLPVQGRFVLPSTGEEVEVYRPAGMTYPADARVKWLTPGEGRETLNSLLADIYILEFDHLARAVVDGSIYRVAPLQVLGAREGGWLETSVDTAPENFGFFRDSEEELHQGKRLDLLLSVELTLRCNLNGFEGQKSPPEWVVRAREVYPDLLQILGGTELFQYKAA